MGQVVQAAGVMVAQAVLLVAVLLLSRVAVMVAQAIDSTGNELSFGLPLTYLSD